MTSRGKLIFVTFLTFVRFPLVLVFLAAALVNAWHYREWLFWFALSSLIASAVTDLFDGYFARKFKVTTGFGAHADPLMDKLFYLISLPTLVFLAAKDLNMFHAVVLLLMTLLFLARDLWVTFLRSIGSMYRVPGGANWAGKVRTALNFPLICCIYHVEEARHQFIPPKIIYVYEIVGVVMTLISIYVYTSRYWSSIKQSLRVTEKEPPAA